VVLALALLVLLLPPVRGVVRAGLEVVREAVAASRRESARRQQVAGYAARYGISGELAEEIHAAAEAERLDPELAFRLVRVESEFREDAVSPVGALGLTQLMPATAAELQPGITREQILHRRTNLRLGFRYMRILLRRYDGDVAEALHAYNRGMGTVSRIRAEGGDPANGYADKVLGRRGASPVHGGAGGGESSDIGAPTGRSLHEMSPARLPGGR
jgi:soluble lytic murein transglycosylase-like protein